MAEQPQDQLSLPKTDAGLLFRVEMFTTNLLLGYWWVLVVAVVIVLAGVAIYGFYDSQQTATQRALAAKVERITRKIDAKLIDRSQVQAFREERGQRIEWSPSFEDQEIRYPPVLRVPLEAMLADFAIEDVEQEPILTEIADELLAVAQTSPSTAGGAHAALLGAELYRLADKPDGRVTALELAERAGDPTFRFSAQGALAQIAASEGDVERAESILRPWITQENGYFGQKAALDLARIYRYSDRQGDAIATLQELKQIWPATAFIDPVDDELEAMGAAPEPASDESAPGIDVPVDLEPGETREIVAPAPAPAGSGG